VFEKVSNFDESELILSQNNKHSVLPFSDGHYFDLEEIAKRNFLVAKKKRHKEK
jgi:hypothetical protein